MNHMRARPALEFCLDVMQSAYVLFSMSCNETSALSLSCNMHCIELEHIELVNGTRHEDFQKEYYCCNLCFN